MKHITCRCGTNIRLPSIWERVKPLVGGAALATTIILAVGLAGRADIGVL